MYYFVKIKLKNIYLRSACAWFRSMKLHALREVKGTGFTDIDTLCTSALSREHGFSSKMSGKWKVRGKNKLPFVFFFTIKQLLPAKTST